jgi:hypothetical protein
MSNLRSHYLVLRSLETLTSQQRFYSTELLMRNGRYYHLLASYLRQTALLILS